MTATVRDKPEPCFPFQDLFQTLAGQQVLVDQTDDINAYLGRHPDLAALLPGIAVRARQEFGDAAQFCLTIYNDPEIEDRYLTLLVRWATYAPDVLSRLRNFRASLEQQLSESSGWFLVTTDFRTPPVR